MNKKVSEVIKDMIDSGISLEVLSKAWGEIEFKESQDKIRQVISNLKEKFREKYIGKYLVTNTGSLDIYSGFSKTIDVKDSIPSIHGRLVKIEDVTVYPHEYNNIENKFVVDLSGSCIHFDIEGVDSDISLEYPIDYYESGIKYTDKFNIKSKLSFLIDIEGNIISHISFKEAEIDLVLELLEYYKKSNSYSIELINKKLGI